MLVCENRQNPAVANLARPGVLSNLLAQGTCSLSDCTSVGQDLLEDLKAAAPVQTVSCHKQVATMGRDSLCSGARAVHTHTHSARPDTQ